ncbi:MAG: phage holin family protein [Dehalococcoidia bacterium]
MARQYRTGSLRDELHRAGQEARALGNVATEIANDLRDLANKELELAKAELSEQVAKAVRTVITAFLAAIFGFLMLAFLAVSAMFALTELLEFEMWASALIVTGGLLLLAVLFGLIALMGARSMQVGPVRTIKSLRETINWGRAQMKWRGKSPSSGNP